MGLEAFSWSRLARQRCSECGSVALSWMRADELPWAVRPADRLRVFEGIRMMGQDGDAWLCANCGGFGIFGPLESTL
jgi:hypothetical protein